MTDLGGWFGDISESTELDIKTQGFGIDICLVWQLLRQWILRGLRGPDWRGRAGGGMVHL